MESLENTRVTNTSYSAGEGREGATSKQFSGIKPLHDLEVQV